MDLDNVLDLADTAHRLHLDYQRVYRLVLTGKLPGRRLYGRWYADREAVDKMAAELAESTAG